MKLPLDHIKKAFSGNTFKRNFQDTLSGDVFLRESVRKHIPLVLLIGLLFCVYIYFGYQAQKQQQRIAVLNHQIEEANFEYLTLSAQLVERTRQSFILKQLEENGSNIKISNTPAIEID